MLIHMRRNLILSLFLILFCYCTKSTNDIKADICEQALPGFLAVDDKKNNGCGLVIPFDSLVEADFGWIKLQYGGDYPDFYTVGSIPHAYIYETYIQKEG